MTRPLSIALAAIALTACSNIEAKAPPSAHPALWKVADADTTIYLFGTIHALPPGTKWRSPALDAAMAKSDVLVLEVASLKDQAALAASFQALAISPGLPPILDRVPADKRDALKAQLDMAKIPVETANKLETWAVALGIVTESLTRLGFSREEGVERITQDAFAARGKPVEGLETATQQFGFFDKLSEDAQRKLLITTLEPDDKGRAEFAQMVAAWSAGDVRRISLSFDGEMKASPELADVLLHRRNAAWADWVAKRLDTPGTVFVAVGAGHLAGTDSVEALVAKKGMRVTRVQ